MPKGLNIKGFGRRKSSGNVLDDYETNTPASPATSSFRVLERPEKRSINGSTPSFEKLNRPFSSPTQQLRGKSAENLGAGQNRSVQSLRNRSDLRLSEYRGSGGTTTSGSSGHYDSSSASARHSSSSTPPSSIDHDRDPDDEELFPAKQTSVTAPRIVKPMSRPGTGEVQASVPTPPSFTARAARALSFGTRQRSSTIKDAPPVPPVHGNNTSPTRSYSPQRERAATTSSYASTAVPPRTELALDLGSEDFGGMFDGLRRPSPSPRQANFHRTDSQPLFPPGAQARRNISPNPSPGEEVPSPYSWDGDRSNEALIASPVGSPKLGEFDNPAMSVGNSITQNLLRGSSNTYSLVPDRYGSPRLESSSEDLAGDARQDETAYPNRQNQLDDEDRWTKRVELHDAHVSSPSSTTVGNDATVARQPTRNGWPKQTSRPSNANGPPPRKSSLTPRDREYDDDSNDATPRATRYGLNTVGEDSMFDTSPIGPASRAVRPDSQAHQSNGMKKMTKAQFQLLQRRGDSSAEQSDEDGDSGDDYDDGNDIERAKQMATQRRKQEANMAVYRQQMKKVTGGGPTDLPNSSSTRPSLERSSMSAPSMSIASSLHFGGISGTPPADVVQTAPKDNDDDDDDVPLGILQAHGFPSNSRPPTRPADNEQQRRMSVTGSVAGGGAGQGNLPPFARRLPADPYFGASLVNHTPRESLAMNATNQPMYSGLNMPPPQIVQSPPAPQGSMGGHPGGLVGVIAGEERARAARRGSPNAATGFAPPASFPLPSNLTGQMPGMPGAPQMTRAMSMGNLAPPQVYTPSGVPPMPMMPPMIPQHMMAAMDPASQQMQQFMQMQMQLMQNMLQMQQAQLGQPTTPSPQPQRQSTFDYLGAGNGQMQRPVSQGSFMSGMQGLGQTSQGRSMTMLNPPTGWAAPLHPNQVRHHSATPSTYAPSMSGALNLSLDGPGPGYTPSIAPSERSNVGMPTRYRPVTSGEAASRTQSMTSSLTLQAMQPSRSSLAVPGALHAENERPRSTIRIVDKLRGTPRTSPRPTEDDEDDGWAEMRKKREEKQKKSRFFKRNTNSTAEPTLGELYHGLD